MTDEGYAEIIAKAIGYLTLDEVRLLKQYAKLVCSLSGDCPIIVNIGAGGGTSGLCFREACPKAEIFSVDIRRDGPYGGLNGELNSFNKAGLPLPYQMLGDSKNIGKAWGLDKISLLFIDADHMAEGVTNDIESWLPHVMVGGYIIFHDYGSNDWPDVKSVVDVLMKDHEFITLVDTVIVFKKQEIECPS